MITVVLLGMGFGLGLFGLVRMLFPARPPLAVALARIDAAAATPRTWPASRRVPTGGGRLQRRLQIAEALIGERTAGGLAQRGLLGQDLQADLAMLDVDEHSYAARKLLLATGTLVLAPVLLAAVAALLGWPWIAAAWLSLLCVLAVVVLPDRRVRRIAKTRRTDFTAATAAYLDLVAMRVASGSGISEALRQAAEIGTGKAFQRIHRALDDARLTGGTAGESLTRLGEQLGVDELTQLGAQLRAVDSSGAQAETSLRAKAEALRDRQLTEARGKANANSQTMVIGLGLIVLGYLILIAYPGVSVGLGF